MSDQVLEATVVVEVLDWWTGEPLQGVPVAVGETTADAFKGTGDSRSTLTDHRGFAMIPMPAGHLYVCIEPDFVKEVDVGAGDQAFLEFQCPDFVRKIRPI